jgi:hypothetical protein
MALHSDIYWVGRQWAVTGFGVQAVDQRLMGVFDIEVSNLWDDTIEERMSAFAWLKADDFKKALAVARERFAEPPRKKRELIESVLELIPPLPARQQVKPKPEVDAIAHVSAPAGIKPAQSALQALSLRLDRASAKFVKPWRIRR